MKKGTSAIREPGCREPGCRELGCRELVLACSEEGVIGAAGRLPWSFRSDFRWFRDVTSGRTLVMGRRTWESLPGPLPGRRNIVLSRTAQHLPGAEVLRSDQLPAEYSCIGGAAVLAALPPPDVVHLTVVCGWPPATPDADLTTLPQHFLDSLRTYRLAAARTIVDRDRTSGRFHHLTFCTFVKT